MNELEQKLYQAMDHAAPQDLDRILAACGPQNRDKVVPFAPPSRRRRPQMAWAAAARLASVRCGGVGRRPSLPRHRRSWKAWICARLS